MSEFFLNFIFWKYCLNSDVLRDERLNLHLKYLNIWHICIVLKLDCEDSLAPSEVSYCNVTLSINYIIV